MENVNSFSLSLLTQTYNMLIMDQVSLAKRPDWLSYLPFVDYGMVFQFRYAIYFMYCLRSSVLGISGLIYGIQVSCLLDG